MHLPTTIVASGAEVDFLAYINPINAAIATLSTTETPTTIASAQLVEQYNFPPELLLWDDLCYFYKKR